MLSQTASIIIIIIIKWRRFEQPSNKISVSKWDKFEKKKEKNCLIWWWSCWNQLNWRNWWIVKICCNSRLQSIKREREKERALTIELLFVNEWISTWRKRDMLLSSKLTSIYLNSSEQCVGLHIKTTRRDQLRFVKQKEQKKSIASD